MKAINLRLMVPEGSRVHDRHDRKHGSKWAWLWSSG